MKQNIVFAVLSVLLRGAVRIVSVLLTLGEKRWADDHHHATAPQGLQVLDE